MKLAAMFLITSMAAVGNDAGPKAGVRVTVHLDVDAPVPSAVRGNALAMTKAMYRQIGVEIRWEGSRPAAAKAKSALWLEVTDRTPSTFHPGALAYAAPWEGRHIRVFWDRIETARGPQKLLAHVLAHEIGHMLEGTDRHSAAGIMKAKFTAGDIADMLMTPLEFTPEDIDLIQQGLAYRVIRAAATARPGFTPKP